MNLHRNPMLVIGVVIVVIAVAAYRRLSPVASESETVAAITTAPATLPRLVDLGADKCIPCKKMAPILAELKTEYAGRANIEFIDIWKNPDAGRPYGIRVIPTQIFFDREGQEACRHEGFLDRHEIVAKLKELGAG